MTQFGATDLLNALMAHFPRDYFPGMSAEHKNTLYTSFVHHFNEYDDDQVLEAFDEWLDIADKAPTISDLLKILSGKVKPTVRKYSYTMVEAEVQLLRKLCHEGFTELVNNQAIHYEGPLVSSAYQDYTVDCSRNVIPTDFQTFYDFIKGKIRRGELI